MCGTYLRGGKVSRTRKAHRCFHCDRRIPKGTIAYTATSAYDGAVSTSYSCQDCEEFSNTVAAREFMDDDCWWPGSFGDEPYAQFPILEPA
jgi:hypothetical protein